MVRVEEALVQTKSLDAPLKYFASAKVGSFHNLLDLFLKICRHSTSTVIATGIQKAQFFRRNHRKALPAKPS